MNFVKEKELLSIKVNEVLIFVNGLLIFKNNHNFMVVGCACYWIMCEQSFWLLFAWMDKIVLLQKYVLLNDDIGFVFHRCGSSGV